MPSVNESTKYTHFSNIKVGTANGGGGFELGGTAINATAAELNAAADQSSWAALDPAADDALTLAEHGVATKVALLSEADGTTFTLPAASGTGATYTVIVSTTVTSNNHIIQCANATDEFYGIIWQIDADTADAVAAYPCLDADGFDTITMNGSTTGGIKGDRFEFTDVAAGHWNVKGFTTGTGTVATPLSAAVS